MTKHIANSNEEATLRTVNTVLKHTVARAKACFGESAYDDASLILISLRKELFPEMNDESVGSKVHGTSNAHSVSENNNNNANNANNNNNNNNLLEEISVTVLLQCDIGGGGGGFSVE